MLHNVYPSASKYMNKLLWSFNIWHHCAGLHNWLTDIQCRIGVKDRQVRYWGNITACENVLLKIHVSIFNRWDLNLRKNKDKPTILLVEILHCCAPLPLVNKINSNYLHLQSGWLTAQHHNPYFLGKVVKLIFNLEQLILLLLCPIQRTELQYIPRNMHTVVLCFALLWLCNRS